MNKEELKKYNLTKQGITCDGHTMFEEDVVKDLNYWYNKSKQAEADFKKKIDELKEKLNLRFYGNEEELSEMALIIDRIFGLSSDNSQNGGKE